jgi:hypothetical protein
MDKQARRNLGAHYTSEKNIFKLIKPLFLDELWDEFNTVKSNKKQLSDFHKKIASLKFLDPACGCGNFLLITYRELRLLELEVLKLLQSGQQVMDLSSLIKVSIDQFYGIEIEEFPAQIAQVAMWLMDHQMNMACSEEFGEYFLRLPLKQSATIVNKDALDTEWKSIIKPEQLSFIIGNPPFIGHQWRNNEQMRGMEKVFGDVKRAGRLDYVAAWYLKAAEYIKGTKIKVAFVSTNSISQGEQALILWPLLFNKYGIKIHFAHRTFLWNNEAKGNAAVHVVIVAFANFETSHCRIYDYENIKAEPYEVKVKNISGYLTEGKDYLIESRKHPIHEYPEMTKGSQPTDGGYLILTPEEKSNLLKYEPKSEKWIKEFIGGYELMNNTKRYCLWLKECPPGELRKMPAIMERLEQVKKSRLNSATQSVKDYASRPALFTQDRQPMVDYLAMPRVSSVNRKYIPIAFLNSDVIAHEKLIIIPNANLFLFGILMSSMHMAWTSVICGRLKSDYSYSPAVYNNFPFPLNSTELQISSIESAAQAVLDARAQFPDSSLADLYDPLTMPPVLMKAHQHLDKVVDQCYRAQPFTNDSDRMNFLFELYEKYTAGLFTKEATKKPKKRKATQE